MKSKFWKLGHAITSKALRNTQIVHLVRSIQHTSADRTVNTLYQHFAIWSRSCTIRNRFFECSQAGLAIGRDYTIKSVFFTRFYLVGDNCTALQVIVYYNPQELYETSLNDVGGVYRSHCVCTVGAATRHFVSRWNS